MTDRKIIANNKKAFVVFGRSYNDIDCRAPLILELIFKHSLNVEIIVIPTISSSGLTVQHDIEFLEGVTFTNVFEKYVNIRFYKILCLLSRFIEQNRNKIIRYRIWPFLWRRILKIILNKKIKEKLVEYLNDKHVIIDDIYLEKERSPISSLLHLNKQLSVYCMSHGQNTLTNLWFDIEHSTTRSVYDAEGVTVYVPSEIDVTDLSRKAKNFTPIIIGNTRFDKYWVENDKLRDKKNIFSTKLDNRKKVLFVMSKLNYGQEAGEARDLILEIVKEEQFVLCIKPHTRGMTLEELNLPIYENLIVEEKCGTRDLISWADIVIFTGSSIIFEAIIRKKPILFLGKIQKYNSIFDNLPQSFLYNSNKSICEALISAIDEKNSEWGRNEFLNKHVYANTNGNVCSEFLREHIFDLT